MTQIRKTAAADDPAEAAVLAADARLRQLSLSTEQRAAMLRMVEGIIGDPAQARRLVDEALDEMAGSTGTGGRVEAFGVYAAFAQVRRRALQQRGDRKPEAAPPGRLSTPPPEPPPPEPAPATAAAPAPEPPAKSPEPTPPPAAATPPAEPDPPAAPEPEPEPEPDPVAAVLEADQILPAEPPPTRRRPGIVWAPPPAIEPLDEEVVAFPALPLRRPSAGRAAPPAIPPRASSLPWRRASEPMRRSPPEAVAPLPDAEDRVPAAPEPRLRPRPEEHQPQPLQRERATATPPRLEPPPAPRASPAPRPAPAARATPTPRPAAPVPRESALEDEPPAITLAELPPRAGGRLSSAWLSASRGRRLRRLVMVLAAVIIASELGLLGLVLAERVQRNGLGGLTGDSGAEAAPAAIGEGDTARLPAPLLDRRPAPEPLASVGPKPSSFDAGAGGDAPPGSTAPSLPLPAPRGELDSPAGAGTTAPGTTAAATTTATPAPGVISPAPAPTADATPLSGARVFIHHTAARAVDAMLANKLAQRLELQGFKVADIRAVHAHMLGGTVRYYFPQDREIGRVLLANLGQVLNDDAGTAERLQDFTHYQPKPEAGTIEIWLPTS